MPELPEVETVAKSIEKYLIGKSFKSIHVNWIKTLDNFSLSDFKHKVKGLSVARVYRRAKYIIIDFNEVLLAVHLRMTGKLYVVNSIDPGQKHISLFLKFDDKYLIFEDTRKFGRFYLFDNLDYLNNKLGIEPLSNNFSKEWILKNIKSKNRQIKPLLLDQSFICGIGNIYADESLWFAKIHPLSISSTIPNNKLIKLQTSIVKVLSESVKRGGTTIRDYTYDFSYVGNYALSLKVFNRSGKKCLRCKSIILKIKVAQRGTHYCPNCQTNK